MNYQETLQYIHQTPKFSRELGNRLLKKLLNCCFNPQKELSFIHIAGTNGKGSVAIMLAEILQRAGYRTGLYISPYLERFNERMQINREPISDDALARIVSYLKETIEKEDASVSEFALDTAAAFLWFKEEKADIVVLETGLGGRLDATNVIDDHIACILTAIGKDHTQYLGDTLKKITAEKCGIFREKRPVISYPCQEEASLSVIKTMAKEKDAPLYMAEQPLFHPQGFCVNDVSYTLSLKGNFQAYNASTVLKTVDVLRAQGWDIPQDAVREGLCSALNPARYEPFGEHILLDGAHNIPAIRALCASLEKENKDLYFCVAMMEDKDVDACVEILSSYAKGVVTTQIDMPRCMDAKILAQKFEKKGITAKATAHTDEALYEIRAWEEKNNLICICGSLYLAGEIRPKLSK